MAVDAETLAIAIRTSGDIVTARQRGRDLAHRQGFSPTDTIFVATAISEVARNIVVHAGSGEIVIRQRDRDGRPGIEIIARDRGRGIPDVAMAMRDGFSTANGLGLGLPGARRLMDAFELQSTVGEGTTVTMGKWIRAR